MPTYAYDVCYAFVEVDFPVLNERRMDEGNVSEQWMERMNGMNEFDE